MNNISIEPVDLENDLPIDILDRQKFVEHLLELLETLVSSDTSCTLALNGKWEIVCLGYAGTPAKGISGWWKIYRISL